jgi:hypothetical protein
MGPDRSQIEIFVDGLFRHASSPASFRTRVLRGGQRQAVSHWPHGLSGGLVFLIEAAEDEASRAANWRDRGADRQKTSSRKTRTSCGQRTTNIVQPFV